MIKLSTEIVYELPLFKTIELLTTPVDLPTDQRSIVQSDINFSPSTTNDINNGRQREFSSSFGRQQKNLNNIYVYVFHHSNAMDMRGTINYFGGI